MRDHIPFVIEDFNGLWRRGDEDSAPSDHFSACNNVQFIESGFETRDGVAPLIPRPNIIRVYNYKTQNGESLLFLDTNGDIRHALLDGSGTVYGPIMHIGDMTDFGFVSWAGRAYITPFTTYEDMNHVKYQKGLPGEFVWVYKGDGSPAREAGVNAPTVPGSANNPLIAFNSVNDGLIDAGIHVISVSFSDGTNDSNGLGTTIRPVVLAPGGKEITVNNIPESPTGLGITETRIWITKSIPPANWIPSVEGYEYFLAKKLDDDIRNTSISVPDSVLGDSEHPLFSPGSLPNPTSGGIAASQSAVPGFSDLGLHIIGVVYESDTGAFSAPGPEVFAVQTFVNVNAAVDVWNIPVSPDPFVTKKHLVASRAVVNYSGNDHGYELFFIPGGDMDNSITAKTVSFYDADLLEDATHLMDNFSKIPAGVTLTTYHGRLVLTTPHNDTSIAYLSAPGEPEAIDQVDGIIVMPLDGDPITTAQEYRDILYTFKKARTMAWQDNGDVPSTWSGIFIDQGIGASVHGIAQVLDSGGVNVEFILVIYLGGLYQFNGLYTDIPLSWKIEDLWFSIDRNNFGEIQIVNDTLGKNLYMTLPNRMILHGNYDNGLDPKNIRWVPWTFDIGTCTITLISTDTLVIGCEEVFISGIISGIYRIIQNKRNDTYWTGPGFSSIIDLKIPDPFIRIGLIGE